MNYGVSLSQSDSDRLFVMKRSDGNVWDGAIGPEGRCVTDADSPRVPDAPLDIVSSCALIAPDVALREFIDTSDAEIGTQAHEVCEYVVRIIHETRLSHRLF